MKKQMKFQQNLQSLHGMWTNVSAHIASGKRHIYEIKKGNKSTKLFNIEYFIKFAIIVCSVIFAYGHKFWHALVAPFLFFARLYSSFFLGGLKLCVVIVESQFYFLLSVALHSVFEYSVCVSLNYCDSCRLRAIKTKKEKKTTNKQTVMLLL